MSIQSSLNSLIGSVSAVASVKKHLDQQKAAQTIGSKNAADIRSLKRNVRDLQRAQKDQAMLKSLADRIDTITNQQNALTDRKVKLKNLPDLIGEPGGEDLTEAVREAMKNVKR